MTSATSSAARSRQPRKPRGQGHERIDEILEATKALYAESGYAGTTTRRIAERVGVSQTALYTHFPDKDAILAAVSERAFRRLEAMLVEAERAAASRRRVFAAVTRAYLEFALSIPVEYEITFMTPRPGPVRAPGVGMHAFQRFRAQVAALMAEGHLRPGDADAVAQAVWAALHGLAALLITRPGFPWVEREALIATLLEGLERGYRSAG